MRTDGCEPPAAISSGDSAGAKTLNNDLSWWAGARLCLGVDVTGENPKELGFGMLAEMVDLAMSRPERERPHLSIRLEMSSNELAWADIVLLAKRSDRPTMI